MASIRQVSFTAPRQNAAIDPSAIAQRSFRNDPRQAIAAELIKNAGNTGPAATKLEGISRIVKQLMGTYMQMSLRGDRTDREDEIRGGLSEAINAEGTPGELNPEYGGTLEEGAGDIGGVEPPEFQNVPVSKREAFTKSLLENKSKYVRGIGNSFAIQNMLQKANAELQGEATRDDRDFQLRKQSLALSSREGIAGKNRGAAGDRNRLSNMTSTYNSALNIEAAWKRQAALLAQKGKHFEASQATKNADEAGRNARALLTANTSMLNNYANNLQSGANTGARVEGANINSIRAADRSGANAGLAAKTSGLNAYGRNITSMRNTAAGITARATENKLNRDATATNLSFTERNKILAGWEKRMVDRERIAASGKNIGAARNLEIADIMTTFGFTDRKQALLFKKLRTPFMKITDPVSRRQSVISLVGRIKGGEVTGNAATPAAPAGSSPPAVSSSPRRGTIFETLPSSQGAFVSAKAALSGVPGQVFGPDAVATTEIRAKQILNRVRLALLKVYRITGRGNKERDLKALLGIPESGLPAWFNNPQKAFDTFTVIHNDLLDQRDSELRTIIDKSQRPENIGEAQRKLKAIDDALRGVGEPSQFLPRVGSPAELDKISIGGTYWDTTINKMRIRRK